MVDIAIAKEKIKQYIVETSYVQPEKVQEDTLIFVDGIFDSMGFLGLINFIEDSFNIKAEDSELLEENFESVNAIGSFIEKKLN
jgi:acyl carrier protein